MNGHTIGSAPFTVLLVVIFMLWSIAALLCAIRAAVNVTGLNFPMTSSPRSDVGVLCL